VKILLIVNTSPWASTRGQCALRFAGAAVRAGLTLAAVYFRDDGVYTALPSAATDAGSLDLCEAWQALGEDSGIDLMLCSAALARRLPEGALTGMGSRFRPAGLVELVTVMQACDRVVTF